MKIVADENIPLVREFFGSLGGVHTLAGRSMTPEVLEDADVLLVRSVTRVSAELLGSSTVRFVGTATIGEDHIDKEYLASREIGFAGAPGSNANSVAEYVVACLLELAQQRGFALAEKTAGVVGLGNVGSLVKEKLEVLGVQCRAHDPPLADRGVPGLTSFKNVLKADIITFHVPLTDNGLYPTRHMAHYDFFMSCRPGTILINTSRGAVFDTGGLLRALRERQDLAAVLDVWEGEPEINVELLRHTAIATPHIAGYSLDGKYAGSEMIYRAACGYLRLPAEKDLSRIVDQRAVGTYSIGETDDEQQQICTLVKSCYCVTDDDSRLRKGSLADPGSRGVLFDRLRKEYPVRREFSCYDVDVQEAPRELVKKIQGLGFHVLEAQQG